MARRNKPGSKVQRFRVQRFRNNRFRVQRFKGSEV
jgi:hypothetical protein